jgi:hypothetical protein
LILYRKSPSLRMNRVPSPQPPFWAATVIAPYGPRRGSPVSIDFLNLEASYSERLEVSVCEHPADELSRWRERHALVPPVLIEASEFAEVIFRRGEEAMRAASGEGIGITHLISANGEIPVSMPAGTLLAVSMWPLDFQRIERLVRAAARSGAVWGAVVPVIHPVTTTLGALDDLLSIVLSGGARFLAAVGVDVDPTARQAIARTLNAGDSDESYASLFHGDLETIHVATERHIAALAAGQGLADSVPVPGNSKSNWSAAAFLMRAASRMLAMKRDTELAWTIVRSASAVAQLDKPIARVAEAASLAIVESLDPISVEALTEFLESGTSPFTEGIDREWRLRRDYLPE